MSGTDPVEKLTATPSDECAATGESRDTGALIALFAALGAAGTFGAAVQAFPQTFHTAAKFVGQEVQELWATVGHIDPNLVRLAVMAGIFTLGIAWQATRPASTSEPAAPTPPSE